MTHRTEVSPSFPAPADTLNDTDRQLSSLQPSSFAEISPVLRNLITPTSEQELGIVLDGEVAEELGVVAAQTEAIKEMLASNPGKNIPVLSFFMSTVRMAVEAARHPSDNPPINTF